MAYTPLPLASRKGDAEVALVLAHGVPNSKRGVPEVGNDMEGERTGLPHLTEHSTRVREAHARFGTQLKPKKVM